MLGLQFSWFPPSILTCIYSKRRAVFHQAICKKSSIQTSPPKYNPGSVEVSIRKAFKQKFSPAAISGHAS
jgi:hypothetical protein